MMRCLPFIIISTLLSLSAWADIHKCLVNGATVYTDKECAGNQALPFKATEINTTASLKVSYKGNIWLKDASGYSLANDAARTENAPIFIYGYTDWCGYCKKLNSSYLSDADVQTTLSQFIKVKLNPEHSKDDDKLFKSWGGTGYPALFVKYPDQPPHRVQTPFTKEKNGFSMISKAEFIAMLEKQLKTFEQLSPAAP